jgi:hypothetical protein
VATAPKPPAAIADDVDLDGPYGDPIIKAADPRDWHGDSQKGKRFSECPPGYLDLVASRLDYFAQQAEAEGRLTTSGKPVAPFNRRDAARARGWAKRLRAGWKRPTLEDESVGVFFGETSPSVAQPIPVGPAPKFGETPAFGEMLSDDEIPF